MQLKVPQHKVKLFAGENLVWKLSAPQICCLKEQKLST